MPSTIHIERNFIRKPSWLEKARNMIKGRPGQLYVSIILVLSIVIVVLRIPLFSSGMIEFGDLVFHMDIEWTKARYFYTWNPYFGGDNGQWLGHYIWFSWLMQLGSSEVVERLLLFVTLMFLGLSAFNVTFAFAKRIFQRDSSIYAASIAATFVTMMNPWTTTRLSQPPYIWMVASSFLLFYFTDKAVHEENRENVIKNVIPASFALVFGSVIFYSLFYLSVLTILLVFLEIVFASQKSKVKLFNGALFLSGLTLSSILLFSFYLLPSLLAFMPKYAAGVPWRVENTIFQMQMTWRNSRIENVFRLSGQWTIGTEFYTGNEVINELWFLSTFVIPFVALAALWVKPHERLVQISNIVAIVFLFVTSLPNEPLRPLFLWLIEQGSLVFDIFRETDRFAGALVFAYAIMGGVTIGTIFDGVKNKKPIHANKRISFSQLIKKIAPIVVIPVLVAYSFLSTELSNFQQIASLLIFAYVLLASIAAMQNRLRMVKPVILGTALLVVVCGAAIFSSYPLLSGNLAGYFQPIDLPIEYKRANEWLKRQKDDSLVMWLPPVFEYPWAPHRLVPEMRYWVTSKSTLIASVPPYKRYFENFIYDTLLLNRTSHIGKILSLANVGYILYHNDSIDASKYDVMFKSLLSQRDLSLVFNENSIYIFKNDWEQKTLRIVNKTLLVVGGLDALIPLLDFDFFKPDDFAIFFLDQKPIPRAVLEQLTSIPSLLLIYGNKDFSDVVLDTIGEEYYYAPYGHFTPLDDPWRADMMYSWLGPRATFNTYPDIYPKGPRYDLDLEKSFIFTVEENANFNFTIDLAENGRHEIWVRVFISPRGGEISLQIDEESFSVNTESHDQETLQGFKWIKVGELSLSKGSHEFSIVNSYGMTWVNTAAIIPSGQVQRHTEYLSNMLSRNNVRIIYVQDIFSLLTVTDLQQVFEDNSYDPTIWHEEGGDWVEDRLVSVVEPVRWNVTDDVFHSVAGPPWFRFHYPENLTISDGVIEVQLMVDNNGTAAYIGFRAQNISNLYIFGFAPWLRMVELSKFTGGKQSRIASVPDFLIELNKWYTLRVELKNESIRCFIDGQLVIDATDITFSGGTIGFWVYGLDTYFADLRIATPAFSVAFDGWPFHSNVNVALHLEPSNGESILMINVDNGKLHTKLVNSSGWEYLKPFNLTAQRIEASLVLPTAVDKIIFYSSDINRSETLLDQHLAISNIYSLTRYQKLSPTEYRVESNVSSPYLLVLMELYDDSWQGVTKEVSLAKISTPVYSAYNVFWVTEGGHLETSLVYTAEGYFHLGILVTTLTAIFSLGVYVLLCYSKVRRYAKSLWSCVRERTRT